MTGLPTANYPNGTIGKSYTFYVYAHNSVGYSVASSAASATPKVSYIGDNIHGIFVAKSCIACHNTNNNNPPVMSSSGASATEYNNIVAVDTLIYQKPSLQVPHGGGMVFTSTSFEYLTLKRWVDDGQLF